jgi:hypothetical protein
MQRLVEQPTGNGELFEGAARLGRVHYHLSVYQHFSEIEHDSVPPNLEVEGRLVPLEALDLAELFRRGRELNLHLADGRALDFSLTDDEGRLLSTGRGLQHQATSN